MNVTKDGPLAYSKIFRSVLLPLLEKGVHRRNMLDVRNFLEDSQWWSKDALICHQKESIDRLLEHAYRHVPYWNECFSLSEISPSDIRTLDDIRHLPIMEKSDIRANKKRMIADNWQGKTWTKYTGGSTGIPLELDYTAESYDWRVACSKRGYSWAMGCEDGRKQAYIWGGTIGKLPPIERLKQRMHDVFFRRKYFNCFEFDAERMGQCLESLNRFIPEYIIGYTNPLYEFAKFINSNGSVNFSPKAILCAAEKLHPFQRETLKSVFNCPVFNTYGSREFMLIAAECDKHEGLHVSMENLYVEIIKEDGSPAKPGEEGDLVITDLHNYGMPFIRYRIGDIAVASTHKCSCGRELTLLSDVVGRSLDIIKTVDGKYVPGEFFPHLMKEFRWINRFQVIQDNVNHLEIKIVKNALFSDLEFNAMQNEVLRVLGDKMLVDYVFVDDIPLTKTGKLRVTISDITN